MRNYLSTEEGNLYQFSGVVSSLSQNTVLCNDFEFDLKRADKIRTEEWKNKFIGSLPDNCSKEIAKDIIR